MPTSLIGPTEALAALLALERLVARMRPDMLCQIAALRKRLSAPGEAAHEWLATRVRTLVDRQRTCDAKRLSAAGIVADIGALERMCSHMLRECVLLRESLPTLRAFERTVTGVRLDMPEHFLLLRKLVT